MNELSPDASKIESIQASKEYQSAQVAIESLRDLKGSIVEVCDFVFDDSLSAQEQLALIDSSLDRTLLDAYIESYGDAAKKVLDYIYVLEVTIDDNPDAQRLIEFLRAEIADLNNELVDFDSVDQYPELKVLTDLNAVLIVGIQNPLMWVLNNEFVSSCSQALRTYVSEFSRIRRERLTEEVVSPKVKELLKQVYNGVNNTDYRLQPGIYMEGSSGDLTETMFMESDLAETLNVVLRDYLQQGYEVTPIVTKVENCRGKEGVLSFTMYDIAFAISNDTESRVDRPVDVRRFYHPYLHGRKGHENKKPLQQMQDSDLEIQTILKKAPVWDGNLTTLNDFHMGEGFNYNTLNGDGYADVLTVFDFVWMLKYLLDEGKVKQWLGGDSDFVDIKEVNKAIAQLSKSNDPYVQNFVLRAKAVMAKYDSYKVVFDLITELKHDESIDTGSKVVQVIAKAREVESSLVGSQVEVSGDLDAVRDEVESEDY